MNECACVHVADSGSDSATWRRICQSDCGYTCHTDRHH